MSADLADRITRVLQNYGVYLPESLTTNLEGLLIVVEKLETMLAISVHAETILSERNRRMRDAQEILRAEYAMIKDEIEELRQA